MQDSLRHDMLPGLDSANARPAPFTCPRGFPTCKPRSFEMLPEEFIILAERSRIFDTYFPLKATQLKLRREAAMFSVEILCLRVHKRLKSLDC